MAVTLDRYIARRDGSLDYLNAFFFLMAQRDYLSSLTSRKNLFINPFFQRGCSVFEGFRQPVNLLILVIA